jgi:hypothetical protein
VDRCQGEHDRDRVVDASHAFRSRAAFDLFPPHATGRRSSNPDHGGTGELDIRSCIAGLLALLLIMFAEVIILVFSLWLLFRTTLPSVEFPEIDDEEI